MRRSLLLGFVGLAGAAVATGVVLHRGRAPGDAPAPAPSDGATLPLSHAEPTPRASEPEPEEARGVAGLDLLHVTLGEGGATASAGAGTARLSVRPSLQRQAMALMEAHHLPEAALVLMDVATGKVLVYASRVDKGPARDMCVEASAPSASVFKIVTAAALVEDAHLGPDTKQCYSGGEQRITAGDLVDDPQRDRWCTTLAGAMGRSINTVFARLARAHLAPSQLEAMASRFGYGEAFAFDVPVQPGGLHVPSEPLDFARTAAGFWNTTLSPLQAATISAIVAGEGEAPRPSIVDDVVGPSGAVVWSAPEPRARRVISRDTASQLETMMEHTVSEGTSYKAFHDGKGEAFLPGIQVAGKTGTLTEAETQRYYTWFTGFAPARPDPDARQVAIAALVVNGPSWQVKANVLARDLLRAYFAEQGVQGVTRPGVREVARHRKK
jgi:peptidoglycan glycosyltransferase